MKYIKLFENFNNVSDEYRNQINEFAWEEKYLYHFTLDDNLDGIYDSGLIPRAEPNSYYNNANEGVCLTDNESFYKTNLPASFMDVLDEYLDDDGKWISEQPFTRLKIDISQLDYSKFVHDDDYLPKNINETKEESVINSLKGGYGVTYLDEIHSIVDDTKDFPW